MRKKEQYVNTKLEKNQKILADRFENCFDFVMRRVINLHKREVLVVFFDGLVKKETVQDAIISPMLGFSLEIRETKLKNLEEIQQKLLITVEIVKESNFDELIRRCLCGDTLIFIDGVDEALIAQTRGWNFRAITTPQIQNSIRGPKEGFTETMLFNVAMLRRKIKSDALKSEVIVIGDVTKTDVCLLYLKDIANPKLVEEIKNRLKKTDVRYIMDSGHIEQLIEDNNKTLFSTTMRNEKPDVVAAKMMKGRVALIVDGSPIVLTMPMLFAENFQAAEDYYARPFYANFVRILRFLAYLITLTLPAFYVALISFHQDMIPAKLLDTLITASAGVPMPSSLEMLIMLIIYEFLEEAILRLPVPLATSIGIVGVLIIGESAVQATLVGTPTVVIAALTFITSAVVSPLNDANAILRIGLLLLGSFFGAIGVFLGMFLILIHLSRITSYGCPYLLPIAPLKVRGLKDIVLRLNIKEILKKDGY